MKRSNVISGFFPLEQGINNKSVLKKVSNFVERGTFAELRVFRFVEI